MANLHQPGLPRQSTLAASAPPSKSQRGAPAIHPAIKLSQSGSLLLDVVRFLAALAVLVDHINADPHLSAGWGNFGALGHEAVCVFFVLSGFVIRFITITRVGTALDYSIDRVSRIYSIVLPALLFTFVCMLLARAIHPVFYNAICGPLHWKQIPGQLFANLTWTAQCWGYDVSALIDGPFWSLSYECIYYVLYALMYYRARRAWLWTALILLIAGPSIAFLYPVWLLGAFTCDLYLHLSRKAYGVRAAAAIFAALLAFVVFARHLILGFIHATDATARTYWITRVVDRTLPFHRHLVNAEGLVPWLLESSVSFYIIGTMTAAFMLLGILLLDRHHPTLPPAVTRWTRTVADSTFALYLFHFPLLVLLVVAIGHPVLHLRVAVTLLCAIVLITVPISMALDRLKLWMRSTLRRRFGGRLLQRPQLARK